MSIILKILPEKMPENYQTRLLQAKSEHNILTEQNMAISYQSLCHD